MAHMIVLVRHGRPEPISAAPSDMERELLPEGIEALENCYPELFSLLDKELSIRIWSSPAMRAQQTAEIVASALDIESTNIEEHTSIYAQDANIVLSELAGEEAACVVVVGHIPLVEDITYDLTGIELPFLPGAVCAIELPEESSDPARLLWFYQGPKVV